jgi:hypothetical protein
LIYDLNPVSGNYCFRGQSDGSKPPIPTVHRIKPIGLLRYQTVFLESFLLYIHQYEKILKTHLYTNHPIEFLAMCQHYKVPTRLLDWSNDILTSLYFACDNNTDKDGGFFICNKVKFKKFDFNKFYEKSVDIQIIDSHIVNPRLRSQNGCFMLWGNIPLNDKTSETYNLYEYCEDKYSESPIDKISIPGSAKQSILHELSEKYGIDNNSIYLNNAFSAQVEKEYKLFKSIADIITSDITSANENSMLTPFYGAFAGVINLQGLPVKPMNQFYPVVDNIIKHLESNGA